MNKQLNITVKTMHTGAGRGEARRLGAKTSAVV